MTCFVSFHTFATISFFAMGEDACCQMQFTNTRSHFQARCTAIIAASYLLSPFNRMFITKSYSIQYVGYY